MVEECQSGEMCGGGGGDKLQLVIVNFEWI